MKKLLRLLGWLLAIVIVTYFVAFTIRTLHFGDLTSLVAPKVVVSILVAACLYALVIPLSALAWGALLRRQGEVFPGSLLASIMAVTQLAKYVPGGVAQPLGRAAMSFRHGMSTRGFTASVIQETLLAMGASVVVGVAFLLVSPPGISRIPAAYRSIVMAGLLASIGALILFARGSQLLPAGLRNAHRFAPLARTLGPAPGARTTLLVFLTYCVNYLLIGFGVWVVGQMLSLGTGGGYCLLTGAFALSWLLGFVVPGAPAGLGVREGVMTILLSGSLEQHRILPFVLALRLMTLVGDGLCFAVGLWAIRRMNWDVAR